MKIFDITGTEQTILPCTKEDIPVHLEIISEEIEILEKDNFPGRMASAIEAGSAFKLSDNSCFLYYKNSTPKIAEGVVFYGKNNPIKLLALLLCIFTQVDTHTVKLTFKLHKDKIIAEYKSLLTPISVRRSIIEGYPLSIRIDLFKKKVIDLYGERDIV